LVAAGKQSGLQVLLGTYPITPASDILHELSKHKNFGITTFQAEDEIAGIGAALGASYGGALGVTTTSGPGIALKSETIGLAVMTELPLVVIDVQRGGPSTGLPTKTEQADLLQAMFGRNGEAPVPVIAPCSPAGWRRPTARATFPTTRTITTRWCGCAKPRWMASTCPTWPSTTPPAMHAYWRSAGAPPTAQLARLAAASAGGERQSRTPTCATS